MIFAVFDLSPITINSMYKLQFFTFIFAVLLPVLSRHILYSVCDYSDFLKMNTRLRHKVHTYVHKVIGDSGTVASGMMGEKRGTPMPIELH